MEDGRANEPEEVPGIAREAREADGRHATPAETPLPSLPDDPGIDPDLDYTGFSPERARAIAERAADALKGLGALPGHEGLIEAMSDMKVPGLASSVAAAIDGAAHIAMPPDLMASLEGLAGRLAATTRPLVNDLLRTWRDVTKTPVAAAREFAELGRQAEGPKTARPLRDNPEAAERVKSWLVTSPHTLNPSTGKHDAAQVARVLGVSKPTAKKYMKDPGQMQTGAVWSLAKAAGVPEWYDLAHGPGACAREYAEERKNEAIDEFANELRALSPEEAAHVLASCSALLPVLLETRLHHPETGIRSSQALQE